LSVGRREREGEGMESGLDRGKGEVRGRMRVGATLKERQIVRLQKERGYK
jgi:hypothetical protein